MTIHRVLLGDIKPQPWRNGGGSTRELLAWPVGKADWQVRVSVATIAQDGPFSAFPGIARCFAVLSGAGVVLSLPGGDHTLTPGTEALAFDGAAAPRCRLLGGATDDLNLMAVEQAGAPAMWRAQPGAALEGTTPWRGMFAVSACTVLCDGQVLAMTAGELLWSDDPRAASWRLQQGGHAWCMELRA